MIGEKFTKEKEKNLKMKKRELVTLTASIATIASVTLTTLVLGTIEIPEIHSNFNTAAVFEFTPAQMTVSTDFFETMVELMEASIDSDDSIEMEVYSEIDGTSEISDIFPLDLEWGFRENERRLDILKIFHSHGTPSVFAKIVCEDWETIDLPAAEVGENGIVKTNNAYTTLYAENGNFSVWRYGEEIVGPQLVADYLLDFEDVYFIDTDGFVRMVNPNMPFVAYWNHPANHHVFGFVHGDPKPSAFCKECRTISLKSDSWEISQPVPTVK